MIPNPVLPPPIPQTVRRRRPPAMLLKMGVVAGLILALLIPLRMIRSVLSERLDRRDVAVQEMTSTWGGQQTVFGPVLIVPYRYPVKVWKEQIVAGRAERIEAMETATARAFFLPARFEVNGELVPDELYRGIYKAVVYRGRLSLSGEFRPLEFADWREPSREILWSDAIVAIGVSDLRGAQGALTMNWGGKEIALVPSSARLAELSGVEARLNLEGPWTEPVRFEADLTLSGSRGIRIAPVGEGSRIRLTSPWPDPSFQGAFLPTERKISESGFEANWNVSYYGRGYPQQWSDREGSVPRRTREENPWQPDPQHGADFLGSATLSRATVSGSLLGVDLISLLDFYRFVERSIKYGALFLSLVFTVFFLFETVGRTRIHPFQYTLVGAALCLFYLALLALSEFIAFGFAYLIGATVSTILISWYSASALRSGARSRLLGAGVGVIYAFLYVLLQLQDYSLLLGTAGLFVLLGLVMGITRRIDWYARDAEREGQA
ncbi:MAG: cell envelope integrity protein CreD [Kiritimatiellia bacterium]|nr:cell envelope integrity protein CreD [Kiritimatiellia bacterium]